MTIIRDENNRPFCFAEVAMHITDLLEVKIDRFTVSEESQAKIVEILNLKNACTEDALRGIRNAVVVILSQMAEFVCNTEGFTFKAIEINRSLSGITAVIDHELFSRGYEV